MSVNKVQLANGETIIDISDSTVTPETLAEGVTAHDASGQKITGKMVPGGGSSVQSDWNQTDETAADFIKNKPFGDFPAGGDTVVWDGNSDGHISMLGTYIKVSDEILTMNDLANGAVVTFPSIGYFVELPPDAFEEMNGMIVSEAFIVIPYDNFDASELFEEEGIVFPEAGIYVISTNGAVSITIPGYTGFPDSKRLSSEYAPVTKFYVNVSESKMYFYTDKKCTVKAKKTDVREAVANGTFVAQMFNGSRLGDVFLSIGYANFDGANNVCYGVGAVSTNGEPTYVKIYTA